MAAGYRIVIARRARAELDALERQHRGRLTMRLHAIAAREPPPGLLAVRGWLHLAACEVLAKRRVLVVYAVCDRRALLRDLLGSELDDELRGRRMARWTHAW